MKAIDVSPSMIGKQARVEAPDVTITGQLQDLGVITETLFDGSIIKPHDTQTFLKGVILNIAGHELRLHGTETVTIMDGDQ